MARILLLGGTGAIGVYLSRELLGLGHDVFITTRSKKKNYNKGLTYIQGNARDEIFIESLLENKYDVIVDFMIYTTDEFRKRHSLLLSKTAHYVFLSTYRVFAESNEPLVEGSLRLLDVSDDVEYLRTDEYALKKARQENILRKSQYQNWTIVRPAITYSQTRFQLGVLEAETIITRARYKCPVVLPREMLDKVTTMTWAGDVARMIAELLLKPRSFCEDFNICTSEYRTWGTVADYYREIIGLVSIPINLDEYLNIFGGKNYQLRYDRMYNRIMDNTKIMKATGLTQNNLTPLFEGLKNELADKKRLKSIGVNYDICRKIDEITHISLPERIYLKEEFNLFLGKVLAQAKKVFNLHEKIRA